MIPYIDRVRRALGVRIHIAQTGGVAVTHMCATPIC